MFKLQRTQIFEKSISEIFPFFETPENLEIITPDDLKFRIKTPKPIVMKVGAEFEYTIRLGIIKFPWKTLITKYDPPNVFQDIQKFGPYKKWEHTHEFFDLGDKTKMIDTVEYDLFPRILRKIINRVYVRKQVEKIFDHRYIVLEKMFRNNEILKEKIHQ